MSLRPHAKQKPAGPVVLVVMDGVGRGAGDEADAVTMASNKSLLPLQKSAGNCRVGGTDAATASPKVGGLACRRVSARSSRAPDMTVNRAWIASVSALCSAVSASGCAAVPTA